MDHKHADMVTPVPPEEQQRLIHSCAVSLVAALAVGACIWIPWMLFYEPSDRAALLGVIISNQFGFLLTSARWNLRGNALGDFRQSILLGLGAAIAAVVLGVAYDVILRWLFGAGSPTIGPWGVVREFEPVQAAFIVAFGVLIGPTGDESFFRSNLCRRFGEACHPGVGVVLSSVMFALSRLDFWNFPAYVFLGVLFCWTYRQTGSLLTPIVAHGVLNAIMFLFLFSGYQ